MVAFNHFGMKGSLEQLAQQSGKLQQQRLTQAQAAFEEAESLFARATASDFSDKTAVKGAGAAYVRALRHYPRHLEACLRLSYLFFLYGQLPLALKYLALARSIEPHAPEVAVLAARIQNPEQSQPHKDPDRLYEHLSRLLTEQSQNVANSEALNGPPLRDPDELRLLQAELSRWQERHRLFESELEELAQELDVSELHHRLRPFEQAIQQLTRRIEASRRFIELSCRIEDMLIQTQAGLKVLSHPTASEHLPQMEQGLEILLDHFDFVADGLDELANQHYDIAPVKSLYKALMAYLEAFRDELDGKQETPASPKSSR